MFHRPRIDFHVVINPVFAKFNGMYITGTTQKLPCTLRVICLFGNNLGKGVSAHDVDAAQKQDYIHNKRIERFM